MSRGVNRVTLIGNLGNDSEVKHTANGGTICNITVATSESWKDKNTGEQQEKTEWHRVVMFKRLAEIAGEYLRKGAKVYIEGKLQTRKWQDKDGQDRYTTQIVAHEMQMLSGKGDNQGGGPRQATEQRQSTPAPAGGFDDSDIPFSPYQRRSVV